MHKHQVHELSQWMWVAKYPICQIHPDTRGHTIITHNKYLGDYQRSFSDPFSISRALSHAGQRKRAREKVSVWVSPELDSCTESFSKGRGSQISYCLRITCQAVSRSQECGRVQGTYTGSLFQIYGSYDRIMSNAIGIWFGIITFQSDKRRNERVWG